MRRLRAEGGRPGAGAEHPLLEEGLGGAQGQVGRQEGLFFRERRRVRDLLKSDEPVGAVGAVMGQVVILKEGGGTAYLFRA